LGEGKPSEGHTVKKKKNKRVKLSRIVSMQNAQTLWRRGLGKKRRGGQGEGGTTGGAWGIGEVNCPLKKGPQLGSVS